MTLTRYGGGTDDYVQINGVPVGLLTSIGVWQDEAKSIPVTTGLQDILGNPISAVRSDAKGYYEFDSSTTTGDLYLDFGDGAKRVTPANLAGRIADLQTALDALTTEVGGIGTGVPTFSDIVDWAASTAWQAGDWRREPDKSLRFVDTNYTSGLTYGVTDTSNSVKVLDPYYTKTEADAAFAAIGTLAELVLYASDDINDAFNPNLNGVEQQSPGTATSCLPELDEPSDGIVKVGVYRFRSAASPLCIAVLTIPAFAISPAAALVLGAISHSVTTTSGSPVVADTSVSTAHVGLPVEAVGGIPAGCFVGQSSIAGTSIRLSSDPLTQVDVNATSSGTVTAHLAPTVAWLAHDRLGAYVLSDAETVYGGAGLKVRIGIGSGSFVVPAAPLAATSFTVTSTSSTAVLNWTKGVGATEHEVWIKGKPVVRGFNLSTYTYTWVLGDTGVDFKVLSRVPGAVGPFTSTVTASPSTVWSLFPQASAGVWDTAKYSTLIGTNTTASPPSATVDAASGGHQIAHLRSAGTGSTTVLNDPQDRALIKAIFDTTARRAWGWRALLSPFTSSALLELYFGQIGGTIGVASGGTDFLRSTVSPTGCSLEGKAATYDPTGEGNGTTVGSFQRFTDTSYATNILTGASRVSGGLITFPSAMTVGGAYKGIKVIADNVTGSGATARQLVSVYYGDTTQYGTDGSGLPLLFTANLTNRFVLARAAGLFYAQQLGKQTTPTAVTGWDIQDYFDILPIAA